jgi:hypothetical protein
VHKPIGVHCVLYIFCVPDISVLDCGLFFKYMTFGMFTCKFINAALVLFLSITGQFCFSKLL